VVDQTLVLRVTDTGPASTADRSVIFEMFHQGSARGARAAPAWGRPLPVRRLSHVLGGSARLVEADPGRTCFEVTLPIPGDTTASRA
jgi:two-component system OmpR family sensor kinase